MPRIRELGLAIPDPELRLDEADGGWRYTEPDWNELRTVVTGHGPKSQERLEFRRFNHAQTAWVRDTILPRPRPPRSPDDGAPIERGPTRPGRPEPSGRSSARRRTATRCATPAACGRPTLSCAALRARVLLAAPGERPAVGRAALGDPRSDDPDLLQPPLDRSFKKPGGYVMRDKLDGRARTAAGEAAEANVDDDATLISARRAGFDAGTRRERARSPSCC